MSRDSCLVWRRPVSPFSNVLKCLGHILAITASSALAIGLLALLGHFKAPAFVMGPAISQMPADVQRRFTVELFIHNASYDIAPLATAVCAVLLYQARIRPPLHT